MNKLHSRHYLLVTVAGMFCWLSTSTVSAQTATNLNCNWCVGPGEVANGAVRWTSLNAAARGYLINQANDVNAAVALVATLQAQVETLQATVAALQANNVANLGTYLRIGEHNEKPAVIFEAANVLVVNGTGTTWGTTDGVGNLIVGYDENGGSDVKTGSHNLVVGTEHTYSSYGGLVAGFNNNVTAAYASVSGGWNSTASGLYSSVSGGSSGTASGRYSSVSGGSTNTASGAKSSVSGGALNTASETYSSVSGGLNNTASELYSSVIGGWENTASGIYSSVSGGYNNEASGSYSNVSGGWENTASGSYSSVSGGQSREASGSYDWVGGHLSAGS